MVKQAGSNWLGKALSIVLLLAILGAIGTLAYIITTPTVGEKFTEFYILGLGGKATDYPKELTVGEEAKVIVGIVNRERETVSYRVEVRIDGVTNNKVEPIVLERGGKFEQIITFTPDKPGEEQKVEFLLYKQGQSQVYQSLHLWVSVKGIKS